ncbi:MAG: glycosyltransferase family 4 protein, partial [Chloroflexota bacterium]|nr:glycosyltransferase family 4 protein [Chloroflexota bacterium]
MRVLVATAQWFPDFAGGSARVVSETARQLASRGHAVTVLAPRTANAPAEELEGNLRLLRVLLRSALPITFTDVTEVARYARRFGRQAFDVMLGHQCTTAVGLWAARLDTPLVRVFHASASLEL